MLRRVFLLLVAVLCLGCSRQAPLLRGVEVVDAYYPVEGEWPSRVVLAADVENGAGRLKLLRGRVRISYDEKRCVVLSLEQKVVLLARSEQRVLLPLRVSVARSTQSLTLREALRSGSTERISVDWQLALRRGAAYAEVEQSPIALDELLRGEQREMLLEMLKSINEE